MAAILLLVRAQTGPSCVRQFDQGMRKCLHDYGGLHIDIVFSLFSNGTTDLSGDINRTELTTIACQHRKSISRCLLSLPNSPHPTCIETDLSRMKATIASVNEGLKTMCLQAPPPLYCLEEFHLSLEECLKTIPIISDPFFKLLDNGTMPAEFDREQVKQKTCNNTQSISSCITSWTFNSNHRCPQIYHDKIQRLIEGMNQRLTSTCKTAVPMSSDCFEQFAEDLNDCIKIEKITPDDFFVLLDNQTLSVAFKKDEVKRKSCSKKDNIIQCMTLLPDASRSKCARSDLVKMKETVGSVEYGLVEMCKQVVASKTSDCLDNFNEEISKCLKKEMISPGYFLLLLSNGTMPAGVSREEILQTSCRSRHIISDCITPLANNQNSNCPAGDLQDMKGTVGFINQRLSTFCETVSVSPDCLTILHGGIRDCLVKEQIEPDHFFNFLADDTFPADVNRKKITEKICNEATKESLLVCSYLAVDNIQRQPTCTGQEVRPSVQNVFDMYEDVCRRQIVGGEQCMTLFQQSMDKCCQNNINMTLQSVSMVIGNKAIFEPVDAEKNKTICRPFENLKSCGTDAVINAGCPWIQSINVRVAFTTLMRSISNFCGLPPSKSSFYVRPILSQCMKQLDLGIRQCAKTFDGVRPRLLLSLLSNGSSGPLPQQANKAQLTKTVCSNREGISECIIDLPNDPHPNCTEMESREMKDTAEMLNHGLGTLCDLGTYPTTCLKKFNEGISNCLFTADIVPDIFFNVLDNRTTISGLTAELVKQKTCSDSTGVVITACTSNVITTIQDQDTCNMHETDTVRATWQNILSHYEVVCGHSMVTDGYCLTTFRQRLDNCSITTLQLPLDTVLMTLENSTKLERDNSDQKKTICGKLFENCRHKVVANIGCNRQQITTINATFNNVVSAAAKVCGQNDLPDACLLNLQKNIHDCFHKVGLDPMLHMSISKEYSNAVIGATQLEAKLYCRKKPALFVCIQDIMDHCPGAENVYHLTGFDLQAMETAVGVYCQDIPGYIKGLKCFGKPNDAAKTCKEDMIHSISTLSIHHTAQEEFLHELCNVRINYVSCDGDSWTECSESARELKRKFECSQIPSRCDNSHDTLIDAICPNTKETLSEEQPIVISADCVPKITQYISQCFQTVTQDSGKLLKDVSKTKFLCKNEVFLCVEEMVKKCNTSSHANYWFDYWGLQRSTLQKSVNLICNDIPLYMKERACLNDAHVGAQQCLSRTKQEMLKLTNLTSTVDMFPDTMFEQFCRIRIQQLTCDLAALKSICADGFLGTITEHECNLVQEQCIYHQMANFSKTCNSDTYAVQLRAVHTSNGSNKGSHTSSNKAPQSSKTSFPEADDENRPTSLPTIGREFGFGSVSSRRRNFGPGFISGTNKMPGSEFPLRNDKNSVLDSFFNRENRFPSNSVPVLEEDFAQGPSSVMDKRTASDSDAAAKLSSDNVNHKDSDLDSGFFHFDGSSSDFFSDTDGSNSNPRTFSAMGAASDSTIVYASKKLIFSVSLLPLILCAF